MADLITITVDSSDVVTATRHTNELTAANDRLENELKPLISKEKEFARAVKGVNDAMRLGVIDNKKAIAQVQALGKSYGYTQTQINRVTASMSGVRKNTNRMNATIQNAGYQFGDFAVQVQSGQNVLVAFSQQGAQLAGLLPGVAGAVTGVALVIGSSLARALLDGSGFFKSLTDAVEDAEEALTSFRGQFKKVGDGFRQELGPEIKEFADILLKKTLDDSIDAVNMSVDKMTGRFSSLRRELNKAGFAYGKGDIEAGLRGISESMESLSDVDPSNAQELRDAIKTVSALIGGEFLPGVKLSKNAMESLEVLGKEFAETLEAIVPEVEEVADSLGDGEESAEGIVVHSRELVQLFGQLQALSAGIDAAFKRTAIQASLIGDGVSKALAGQMASMRMKISEERAKLVELVGPRFADELLGGRAGQLATYEQQLAQINASSARSGSGLRRREDKGGTVDLVDEGEQLAQAYAKFQEKLDGVLLSRRQEILLNREIVDLSKEEQDLVKALGVTRSQLTDIQKQSYDEILELRREDIALLKQQQAEEEKLAKAKEKVQAVSEVLASETVGALKSIVNGTKTASEAFRDMALNIIQQIMDILIWQPLITSLTNSISGSISGAQSGGGALGGIVSSLFGFQKGGAFSSGNVIPFAYGGVVNSPTTFGMSGGRTGLMGEAGPEAIMPLKRGSDGKLGVEGGGNVTVHQTFNFSANGDESVKKIIAQAAPKIAQMTEAKIINSRQRGGQMRRAFG